MHLTLPAQNGKSAFNASRLSPWTRMLSPFPYDSDLSSCKIFVTTFVSLPRALSSFNHLSIGISAFPSRTTVASAKRHIAICHNLPVLIRHVPSLPPHGKWRRSFGGIKKACLVRDISLEAPLRARSEISGTGTQSGYTIRHGHNIPMVYRPAQPHSLPQS